MDMGFSIACSFCLNILRGQGWQLYVHNLMVGNDFSDAI
jgi:hypothetical protein